MPFRPPGGITALDPSTVRVGPLTAVPAVPQSARPDALKALKLGLTGPYPILADLDRDLKSIVAALRASGGDWSRVPRMPVDMCIANSMVEMMHFSAGGKARPDDLMRLAAEQFRAIAVHDCGADPLP